MRLIDADTLIKNLDEYEREFTPIWVRKKIEEEPTVEAYTYEQAKELVDLNKKLSEEKPCGEWIRGQGTYGFPENKCSNCDGNGNQLWHFCPWCGTKMVKEGDKK